MNTKDASAATRIGPTPSGVKLERLGRVAVIELDRPAHRNAIDLAMAQRLRVVVTELADSHDGLGAVVVAGAGRDFCVGGDLRHFADAASPEDYIRELAETVHDAILVMRALPLPVIASVQGACAGAGLGLILAADLVVAESTSRFVAAYSAVGLSPDGGVSWGLTRLLGAPRAADMILTNRELDGREARDAGLISRMAEPSQARAVALDLALQVADGARTANRHAVRLIRASSDRVLSAHLHEEAELIADALGSAEGAEGVAAFLAKRRPDFHAARTSTPPTSPAAPRME